MLFPLCQSSDVKQDMEKMQQMPTSEIRATSFSYVFRGHLQVRTVLTHWMVLLGFFPKLFPWILTVILLDFNFLVDVAYKKAAEGVPG